MNTKTTNIKERILYLSEYKGIAKGVFFKNIGMTYGNFKGPQKHTALNSDAIDKILTIYDEIDANWLLTGKGSMLKNKTSEFEKETVTVIDGIDAKLIEQYELRLQDKDKIISGLERENSMQTAEIVRLKIEAEKEKLKKEIGEQRAKTYQNAG